MIGASFTFDFSPPISKQAQPAESQGPQEADRARARKEDDEAFSRLLHEQVARSFGLANQGSGSGTAPVASAFSQLALTASPSALVPASTPSPTSWWGQNPGLMAQATAPSPSPSPETPLPQAAAESHAPAPLMPWPLPTPVAQDEAWAPVASLHMLPGVQSVHHIAHQGPQADLTELHLHIQSPQHGPMMMRVDHQGGKVGVELSSLNPHALGGLASQLHEVASLLHAHGLQPGLLRVAQASSSQSGRGAGFSSSEQRGASQGFWRRRPAHGEALEADLL